MDYFKFFNVFIILTLGLLPTQTHAQMFDYNQSSKKDEQSVVNDKYNRILVAIERGFNQFEENLRFFSVWEVKQYKRVIIDIERETKGFPPARKDEYKNTKLVELSILLREKELELQFQYLEMVDDLNSLCVSENLEIEFYPMMKVEGRLQDAVIKMATEEIKDDSKYDKIKSYTSWGTAAGTLAIPTVAATAATGVGIPVALAGGAVIVTNIVIDYMITYTVEEIVDNILPSVEEMAKIKSWYFINGFCVNAKKTYIEQVQDLQKLKG